MSETLDALVSAARTNGPAHPGSVRSVAGTVDIAGDDPKLDEADDYIRGVFATSHAQPFPVRGTPSPAAPARKGRKSRG